MYEIRCPSCRLRVWLYQGMGRNVPAECPSCHVSRPIDASARLAARIGSGAHPSDHQGRVVVGRRATDAARGPRVGRGASR